MVIPDSLCHEQMGSFTFVNFTGSCTTGLHPTDNHGFYAAVFRASDGWGFFEVEGVNTMGGPGGTVQSLAQFEKAVLARNPGTSFSSGASNTYTTLQGDTITFAPINKSLQQWNLTGLTRNCSNAVNPDACRAQALPVVNGIADTNSVLAGGDFISNTDPATGVKNAFRLWITNPYMCQRMIMDYSDVTNPFYADPNNPSHRLCDPVQGQPCQSPCTATATGVCSCPILPACAPPSDVTGPMALAVCHGVYMAFSFPNFNLQSVCPDNVPVNYSHRYVANDGAVPSFVDSSGARVSPIKGNGTGPQFGVQFDFPTSVATLITAGRLLTLSPGRYPTSLVDDGDQTLSLPVGGDYMINGDLVLDGDTELQMPANRGLVRMLVTGNVKVDKNVTIVPAGAPIALIALGSRVTIESSGWSGTIMAPNGRIFIDGPRNGLGTSLWAKDVKFQDLPRGWTLQLPRLNPLLTGDRSAFPSCAQQ